MPSSVRKAFLSSLASIFLVAYLSYYVQYPGLLSTYGIESAANTLPQRFPSFFPRNSNFDVDSWLELSCLLGVCISCIVVSGICQHGALIWILTAIYYVLIQSGSTFFQFQWDVLLVEVGFVTGLCYAPWTALRTDANDDIGAWPIRFLLFKLMFMSGVVKIQSNCPTWLNLTALEYHFATQCLPGPLAWYAHQLHPLFLRISVLATLIIEIPSTFLLIAPIQEIRWIGAVLQITLQVMIMLTGNYNFFNLLTMAMCIPCLDRSTSTQKRSTKVAIYVASVAILIQAIVSMGQIEYTSANQWNATLKWNKADCDWFVERTIPIVIPACIVFTIVAFAKETREKPDSLHIRSNLQAFLKTCICCWCIGILSVPILSLTPTMQRSGFWGSQLFTSGYQIAQRHHLSNGYGLFRRMTGVGTVSSTDGWAGLAPSIVERPEIIIEVQYENQTDDEWHELEFRWKPGNITQLPLQVAPHQPRLDWQMWFAALSSYNYNPWFLSFLDKLLDNCPPVLDLLQPLPVGKRIMSVRSELYHYDFTRLSTRWSMGIPGTMLLDENQSIAGYPPQVWTRRLVKVYTPALKRGDRALKDYLLRAGYAAIKCGDYSERCRQKQNKLCSIATVARKWNHIWFGAVFSALKRLRLYL
eukprot:scaffold6708_cov134-Cylindrotheca_fusiformis.AAC.6